MRVLLALAILVTISLLAASRPLYALRRTRWGGAMISGGWLLVAVGFSLGPFGARLITPEQVMVLQPLVLFCLGWAGLIVGLQAHRRLPELLPSAVKRISLIDMIVSLVGLSGATLLTLGLMTGDWRAGIAPALAAGVCGVGWSPETRSLRTSVTGSSAAALVQACGGLAAILAILVYGLFIASLALDETGTIIQFSAYRMGVGLGMAMLIGVTMGLIGNWLMALAGRGAGEFLVVLLGLVSFTAGAAVTMGYSPLFTSLLTGVVVVNLPGKSLEKFKRVIMQAEQPIAMALMAVAGLILDPTIGIVGLSLLGILLVARAVLKQGLMRPIAKRVGQINRRAASLAGVTRQSPIAIALATGYAISPYGRVEAAGISGPELLAVIIALGLISDIWGMMQATRRRAAAEGAATVEQDEEVQA